MYLLISTSDYYMNLKTHSMCLLFWFGNTTIQTHPSHTHFPRPVVKYRGKERERQTKNIGTKSLPTPFYQVKCCLVPFKNTFIVIFLPSRLDLIISNYYFAKRGVFSFCYTKKIIINYVNVLTMGRFALKFSGTVFVT